MVSEGFPSYSKASPQGSGVGVRFPASFTWQTDSLIALRGDHDLVVRLLEILICMFVL